MVVSLFVDQAAPDSKKYFTKYTPGWQGKTIEVMSVTTFVYSGRDEDTKKLDKRGSSRSKWQAFLAAALIGKDFKGRQRNSRNQRSRNQIRGSATLEDCCSYCKQSEHWRRECPGISRKGT